MQALADKKNVSFTPVEETELWYGHYVKYDDDVRRELPGAAQHAGSGSQHAGSGSQRAGAGSPRAVGGSQAAGSIVMWALSRAGVRTSLREIVT